jgi:hypothetical protein
MTTFISVFEPIPAYQTRVQSLHTALMYCESIPDVQNICRLNCEFVEDNPEVILMFARRMNAIELLQNEKLDSYRNILN